MQDEKRLAPSTQRTYAREAREFLELCAARPASLYLPPQWEPGHLDKRAVEIYLEEMRRRGQSDGAVARKATALRALFDFLISRGHLQRNPARNLRPAYDRTPGPVPDAEEEAVRRLFEQPAATLAELRLHAVLELLYGGAMRPKEVYELHGLHCDAAGGEVHVETPHGARTLPLSAAGIERLQRYLAARGQVVGDDPDATLWVTPRGRHAGPALLGRQVRRAMQAAGLPGGAGALRHIAARHFRRRGADIRSVQHLLQQRTLGRMDRYGAPEPGEVFAQLRRVHPRSNEP